MPVTGAKAPPVLLIGETLDAATPLRKASRCASGFPRSVLVEGVGGTTHAGSLFGNACVDDTVAAYLRTRHPAEVRRGERRRPQVQAPRAAGPVRERGEAGRGAAQPGRSAEADRRALSSASCRSASCRISAGISSSS